MTDVYAQFDKAFGNVSAYGLMFAGENVGRVVFKHGAAVTAYVQLWSAPMTKGRAGGGGYDRASAAFDAAAAKLDAPNADHTKTGARAHAAIVRALRTELDGHKWSSRLEGEGFEIINVIA